jgi:hypothetical protein
MQGFQMKFQRIVMFLCLGFAGLMVIYTLGYSTDIYPLFTHRSTAPAYLRVDGADVYNLAQPFNRTFLVHVLMGFLVCVTLFLTLTHTRRRYQLSNYVTSCAFAGVLCFLGAELLSNAVEHRAAYLLVDFEQLIKIKEELLAESFTKSTFIFDTGIVLSILLFVLALALIVNLVLKTIWMKNEKWLEEGADAA